MATEPPWPTSAGKVSWSARVMFPPLPLVTPLVRVGSLNWKRNWSSVRSLERSTALGARTSCWKSVRPEAGEDVGVLAGGDAVVDGWVLSSMPTILAMMLPRGLSGVGAEVTVLARRAARATMLVKLYIIIF